MAPVGSVIITAIIIIMSEYFMSEYFRASAKCTMHML